MSFIDEKNRRVVQTATSASREKPRTAAPGTAPWKRSNLTGPPPDVLEAYPGHKGAWKRLQDIRQDSAKEDGWKLARKPSKPGGKPELVGADQHVDGTQLTSCYKRRDCVYMVLSADRVAAREQHLHEERMAALGSVKGNTDEDMAKARAANPAFGAVKE